MHIGIGDLRSIAASAESKFSSLLTSTDSVRGSDLDLVVLVVIVLVCLGVLALLAFCSYFPRRGVITLKQAPDGAIRAPELQSLFGEMADGRLKKTFKMQEGVRTSQQHKLKGSDLKRLREILEKQHAKNVLPELWSTDTSVIGDKIINQTSSTEVRVVGYIKSRGGKKFDFLMMTITGFAVKDEDVAAALIQEGVVFQSQDQIHLLDIDLDRD